MTTLYEVHGSVALITLHNPPVNSLGLATRVSLAHNLQRARDNSEVTAIVLTGAGRAFSGGADIHELGSADAMTEPSLPALISAIEDLGKPVTAAMASVCMGGGLALALGCHYRMAAPDCSVAMPEVRLGLIPGAGGTQRLPRVIGVEAALNMMLDGTPVAAEQLAALSGQTLFDLMAASAQLLVPQALEWAARIAGARPTQPLPRIRDLPCIQPDAQAWFHAERAAVHKTSARQQAPLKCIEAVEAATLLPFDAGLALERDIFRALLDTPQSRALRHAFMAERTAAKIPGLVADTPRRNIHAVGVVGAGTMGGGIAMNFLTAGIPVTLLELTQEALDRGIAGIRKNCEARVSKGKLSRERYAQQMALLRPSLRYEDLGAVDLVVEAAFEDLGVKETVFRAIDRVARPGAILASNTSTLDVDRIASFTRRPQDVVGLHFFSPAHVMKLLEVVRGRQTHDDVMATVMALGKTLGKTCVVSGVCDGFIGNRMLAQYGRQAGFLLDEGCTPAQVDGAIERFGTAMGPFRMSDMAGNDISYAIRKRLYVEKPGMRFSRAADLLCEQGRLGQKTGAGWYDYEPGKRDARPSAQVVDMVAAHRASLGIRARDITDEEIVQRMVYALVNEGAHLLEEGIAQRAGDIDVVYLMGYGFPRHLGGPMHYASEVGLASVVRTMEGFARNPLAEPTFWTPAPLLARLAAEGRPFT